MKVYITKNGNYLRVYYLLNGKKVGSNIPINGDIENARVLAQIEKETLEKKILSYGRFSTLSKQEKEDVFAAKHLLRNTGVTLIEAARGYLSSYTAPGSPGVPWSVLVEKFLSTKKNLNPNTFEWYSVRLNRTLKRFGKVPVNKMEAEIVLEWVLGLGNEPQTAKGYLQAINAAYRFATREDQNLAEQNPFKYAKELIPKAQKRVKGILTPIQGHLLLWAIADHWKAAYAVRYFTGLRVETLQKTDWGQVDAYSKLIVVHPFADKKNEERFITDIPGEFWEWHKKYAPTSGPMVSSKNSFVSARRSAWQRLAAISRAFPFPTNVLRRSFASYGIHTLGLTETILTMSHNGEPNTFWNNYYRRAVPATAKAYFGIVPGDRRFKEWDQELAKSEQAKAPNFRRALKQWRKDWSI
jgi:integrase